MIQTSMFKTVHRAITERARCVKHNLLDGVAFRTSYRGGMYSVHTEDGLEFRFPFNPYTSFFEIGGYLAEGAWRLEPGMWVLDAGGPRLDLIKMDIEGAEIEAVEGAGDVLERFRPRFSIASYHARDGKQTCELLEPMFHARGYHVRTGFHKHLTTYAAAEPIPFAATTPMPR